MEGLVWFDTHAHLSDPKFDVDREDTLARALEAGVRSIVEIADGPETWKKASQLADQYPGRVWWAAGFHPYYADQDVDAAWGAFAKFQTHPGLVGIGEVGLDYFKCDIPADVQKRAFIKAIEISQAVQKPLIVHCRDAYRDMRELLQAHTSPLKDSQFPHGVIHCFSGQEEDAREFVRLGFVLGVDGPVTYPKADSLRKALASVSISDLVIETDCPYLPPQPYRGQRNEPAYVPVIGQALARLFGRSDLELAGVLLKNSFRLFRLKQI